MSTLFASNSNHFQNVLHCGGLFKRSSLPATRKFCPHVSFRRTFAGESCLVHACGQNFDPCSDELLMFYPAVGISLGGELSRGFDWLSVERCEYFFHLSQRECKKPLLSEEELDSLILKRPFLPTTEEIQAGGEGEGEIFEWHEEQWRKLAEREDMEE